MFYQVGKWYVPDNKYDDPEKAASRISSWLRNYSVDTMVDLPNRVIFQVIKMQREKNSPFRFINYGMLTIRKVENEPYLEVEYRINMAKSALTLIFFPVNQEIALAMFRSIIFEGLTKDPVIMPITPSKLFSMKEYLFLYVVLAPIPGTFLETLRLWPDISKSLVSEFGFKELNPLSDYFAVTTLIPVGLLCWWMVIMRPAFHDYLEAKKDKVSKNLYQFMVLMMIVLPVWASMLWAIYRVYLSLGDFMDLHQGFQGFQGFSFELWMVGLCVIWLIGLLKIFKGYLETLCK